jgi:hypothetical protein
MVWCLQGLGTTPASKNSTTTAPALDEGERDWVRELAQQRYQGLDDCANVTLRTWHHHRPKLSPTLARDEGARDRRAGGGSGGTKDPTTPLRELTHPWGLLHQHLCPMTDTPLRD